VPAAATGRAQDRGLLFGGANRQLAALDCLDYLLRPFTQNTLGPLHSPLAYMEGGRYGRYGN
jgi:hypothetical protein